MNTNSLISDLVKIPEMNTSQRIVPESNRYRWEQQWLKENRDASEVIYSNRESSGESASISAVTKPEPVPTQSFFAEDPVAVPLSRADNLAGNISTTKLSSVVDSSIVELGSAANSIPSIPLVPIRESGLLLQDIASIRANTSATAYKDEMKQFALWRSGNEIKISMRLPQSDTQISTTLSALRTWLKDLRFKLSSLIINGNVQWQAKPRNKNGY